MRGVGNEAQIGLVILIEWGWHADDNGIHLGKLRIVGGRRKTVLLRRLYLFGSDAVDIGAAFRQRINLASVDIETRNFCSLYKRAKGRPT